MMLTLLGAALVGDLIFLPAILASPLGKCFCPKPAKKSKSEPATGQVQESVLESTTGIRFDAAWWPAVETGGAPALATR